MLAHRRPGVCCHCQEIWEKDSYSNEPPDGGVLLDRVCSVGSSADPILGDGQVSFSVAFPVMEAVPLSDIPNVAGEFGGDSVVSYDGVCPTQVAFGVGHAVRAQWETQRRRTCDCPLARVLRHAVLAGEPA